MIRRSFWDISNISNILKEIIEPEAVDVTSIKMNDTLSPLVWESDNKIKSEVRKILLKNAVRFIEYADVENLKYDDIIITGSMANFNYYENSDIDIHIIMDFNQISENKDFVNDFFKLKKQLWEEKIPIQVKGHDVEIYFQDSKEPHRSSGTYSLIKDKWNNKPIKKIVDINTINVKAKAANLMNSIDDLSGETGEKKLSRYTRLKEKIKKMRMAGLNKKEAEYSTENLAFKILRNSGYLQKLMDIRKDYLTKELSLNEE